MTDSFSERYQTGDPPWEIHRPQPAFVEHADRMTGQVLDVGCGTGTLALYASSQSAVDGVLGVDPSPVAIERARAKADETKSLARFAVGSALELAASDAYDTVLDCLVFHIFDDDQRAVYVDRLRDVLRSEGTLLLLVFSDAEPEGAGPRRVSEKELREAFADGFTVESLSAMRFPMNDDGTLFTPGGPHGWFAVIRRDAVTA